MHLEKFSPPPRTEIELFNREGCRDELEIDDYPGPISTTKGLQAGKEEVLEGPQIIKYEKL